MDEALPPQNLSSHPRTQPILAALCFEVEWLKVQGRTWQMTKRKGLGRNGWFEYFAACFLLCYNLYANPNPWYFLGITQRHTKGLLGQCLLSVVYYFVTSFFFPVLFPSPSFLWMFSWLNTTPSLFSPFLEASKVLRGLSSKPKTEDDFFKIERSKHGTYMLDIFRKAGLQKGDIFLISARLLFASLSPKPW